MKKYFGKLFVLVTILSFISCATTHKKNYDMEENLLMNETNIKNNFIGSEYKGNYVWSVAMNLAWNEFSTSILNEALLLNTKTAKANDMLKSFNSFDLNENILDKESYYVKAGYGQKTLNTINKEVKHKFPKKSFDDMLFKLSDTDIISYAYFLKELKYEYEFHDTKFQFMGKTVKGFCTTTPNMRSAIEIIDYTNNDKFIISLKLKNNKDCLILAKGYDMENPSGILKIINNNNTKTKNTKINKNDYFCAANINLNCKHIYKEFIGLALKNKGFEKYTISEMFENIKFKMDKAGARVENEAVIIATKSASIAKPRKLIMNKPYWIIMKRQDSKTPYFLLGVNNTELMEKSNTEK